MSEIFIYIITYIYNYIMRTAECILICYFINFLSFHITIVLL